MSNWAKEVVTNTKQAFKNAGNKKVAQGAANYMKNISPFIGISSPKRRDLTKKAWQNLSTPTEKELITAAKLLWKLPQREFQYAACDLIGKYIKVCTPKTLEQITILIKTKSWWDSVDLLGTQVISPLTLKYPETRKTINKWNNSKNIWLIRCAIQHQRGHKSKTDLDFVLKICQKHINNPEFFVAKAIGWALRDFAKINPGKVKEFLKKNPSMSMVSKREALKGLKRL